MLSGTWVFRGLVKNPVTLTHIYIYNGIKCCKYKIGSDNWKVLLKVHNSIMRFCKANQNNFLVQIPLRWNLAGRTNWNRRGFGLKNHQAVFGCGEAHIAHISCILFIFCSYFFDICVHISLIFLFPFLWQCY